MLAEVSHRNIVTFLGSFTGGGLGESPWLVMELCQQNLAKVVHLQRTKTAVDVWYILKEVGSALDCMHSKGIIHRYT